MLLAPGLAHLAGRHPQWLSPAIVPLLCLVGSLGVLGGALFEAYAPGGVRAGMGNNPVHFGGMAAQTVLYALVLGTLMAQGRIAAADQASRA